MKQPSLDKICSFQVSINVVDDNGQDAEQDVVIVMSTGHSVSNETNGCQCINIK